MIDDISVTGIESVLRQIEPLTQGKFVEGLLDEAEALLLNRIRTRYLAESGPDGPWEPSQAGQKRRSLGGTGTLFDTGTLFHSIQAFTLAPGARAIRTDVPYAGFMNFGTKNFKPRLFMGFSDQDVQIVEKLVIRRVEEALG